MAVLFSLVIRLIVVVVSSLSFRFSFALHWVISAAGSLDCVRVFVVR